MCRPLQPIEGTTATCIGKEKWYIKFKHKKMKPHSYHQLSHCHRNTQGELECLGCGVVYNSIHGLHCHLNATR